MAQAALCDARFYPLHDRMNPPSMLMNVYRASDDSWFLLVLESSRWPALAKGIGRPDLLTDPRFSDAAKQAANSAQLTAILEEVFGTQPMAHWHEVFERANITFGRVQTPAEVIKDPQLQENDIVVPLEGAGGNLTSTISSPIRIHGVTKVPARRGPGLGEHNEEVLKELGFDATEIDGLRLSGAIPKEPARMS
jgi:formyl-CoA transferase